MLWLMGPLALALAGWLVQLLRSGPDDHVDVSAGLGRGRGAPRPCHLTHAPYAQLEMGVGGVEMAEAGSSSGRAAMT